MSRGQLWMGVIVCAAAMTGCASPPSTPTAPGTATAEVKGPYAGTITGLPKPGEEIPRILIEHAPIAGLGPVPGDYVKTDDGPVTMPFWTDVQPASLHEKDRVQFCLKVNWDEDRPLVITALEPLAAGGEPTLVCR